jgi:hypothetical protein
LSAFACVRIGGETFQEKDILDHQGKIHKLLFYSGKAPLRNGNSGLKNEGLGGLRVKGCVYETLGIAGYFPVELYRN